MLQTRFYFTQLQFYSLQCLENLIHAMHHSVMSQTQTNFFLLLYCYKKRFYLMQMYLKLFHHVTIYRCYII